ncbi:MAG: LpqB family beta-propeller domain-containing protein [Chloroflexi bacterium]|nr:LpqB family beta-propeller domain-containing protein [Chloroflexota bacterium]MCY3589416.1 LpqB family beta-propeller domain-containing protein [Chloroflexota bacterium]MCY3686461.1 LpqB family beta-propeller domain-containing protein [Chloroflexota bacterium]MDE2708185.1 LpqB family beta-propeller domain-containing protein [Chloroflexota bacterium]
MELISAENGMSPTWSPDGQQIAFLSNRAEGWDLYTMPAAGGDATRLTSGATVDNPAWSPDGRWIAVERNHRIEAIAPDGSEREVLVDDASHPTWSPSLQLAFVRNRDLYVLEPDGTQGLVLRDADQPHWSADGETIVFARHGIWELDVGSDRLRQRTQNATDESPCIQFDGDIVFIRNAQLMIIHQDDSMTDISYLPSPAGAPDPHPLEIDTVAFQLHVGGNWDIVTASLEHGNVRKLTRATWTSWNARL